MRSWASGIGGLLDAGKSWKERLFRAELTSFFKLITTIRSLVKPDELESMDVSTKGTHHHHSNFYASHIILQDIYDLTCYVSDDHDPMYVEKLRNKMHDTERLVTSFMRLGGKQESLLLQNEAVRQCHKAQTEVRSVLPLPICMLSLPQCSTLRSEVSLLNAKLRDSEEERERYHEQLVAAEKRLDRVQSKAVAFLNPDTQQSPIPSASVQPETQDDQPAGETVQDRAPSGSSVRILVLSFYHLQIIICS
jgi:E3 ubiquitin-protein ligase BRE1